MPNVYPIFDLVEPSKNITIFFKQHTQNYAHKCRKRVKYVFAAFGFVFFFFFLSLSLRDWIDGVCYCFCWKCMPTCQKDYMRISSSFHVFCSTWKWEEACSHEHVAFSIYVYVLLLKRRITERDWNAAVCIISTIFYTLFSLSAKKKQEKHAYVFGQTHANQLQSVAYVYTWKLPSAVWAVSVWVCVCVYFAGHIESYVVSVFRLVVANWTHVFCTRNNIFSYKFHLMWSHLPLLRWRLRMRIHRITPHNNEIHG